ncbi:MAG: trehalose-phosphatase [Candidatus Micrarchaeota archaeon]
MKTVIADFDGTLAAIRRDPKKVKIATKTLRVLEKLRAAGVKVIVLSGRPKKFLRVQLPHFVMLLPGRGNVVGVKAAQVKLIWKTAGNFKWQKGIEIEKTSIGAVVHYRNARGVKVNAFRALVEKLAKTINAKVFVGRKAFEILPVELNDKKCAVEKLLKSVKGEVYFFGDDDSDAEAAEVVLKHGGSAFLIRTSERSYAPRNVKELTGIVHLIKMLLRIIRKEEN